MTLPPLPPGYTAGPLLQEHEQGAVDAINAAYRWMNGGIFTTLEDMQVDWNNAEFDRANDTHVVLAPDGCVAAYADIWDITALHVRWFSLAYVHPEHTGRGVGSYLANWSKERAQQKVHLAPEGTRVVLQQGSNPNNQLSRDLLLHNGFQVVRSSYRMRIEFDAPPPEPAIPEGIVIRPYRPEEERAMFYAHYESFQDHWGAVNEPFEDFYKQHKYYLDNDPIVDSSLWFVALDGNEVAGVSLCVPKINEDPGMGWVNTLGVRRPWRKRGLGLALLQHSFAEFYRRGIRRAGLGVDADNLTGALRLYEKAGMRVWRKNCTYEYELRPGKDLMKQS